jgi:hypothetical protein
MVFNYPDPPLVTKVTTPNGTLLLHWPALVGRKYTVEGSEDLENWSVVASNIVALSGQQSWTAPVGAGTQFYRVVRLP